MATYPGMTLGGEVRESVSLDEDDLSDVEDEVFIRDGKNGYKFAEDIGVKRPLMAPRRKLARSELSNRIKNRPSCRALCKPCCYVFGALTILIGLIVLVVILVSMFPLPVDKLKSWIIAKTTPTINNRFLPCNDLIVTDVWTVNLPKLTSESVIRTVDIDKDGVEDVIFGFGTGDNYNINPDIFCPMFMGVAPPCGGGVMALNGSSGDVIWKRWLSHTIFTIYCVVDVNGDGVMDCLATGKGGIFCVIDSKNGTIIWQFNNKSPQQQPLLMDTYMANFIPDQDNDGINDIIAAHTSETDLEKLGRLILVSGSSGVELQRVATPDNVEAYYPPQILWNDRDVFVIFGTGSPTSPGNLSVVPLHELANGFMGNITTLYQDKYRGIISPSVLVDITGDNITDIIISMFNSTTVAIDGSSFKQLWNFTIPNSETQSIPTPGYFNDDNVTDFLVKYQTGPGFPVYYYSQTFIIDGNTGRPIYEKPIIDSVGSQMGGLTLAMENYGLDWFLSWKADCKYYEEHQDMYEFIAGSTAKQQNHANICKLRFNSSMVAKMFALNQYDQPPGIEIYSSDNRSDTEYNNTKTPLQEAKEYFKLNPSMQLQQAYTTIVADTETPYKTDILRMKHKENSFRHKGNNQGLIKEYMNTQRSKNINNLNPDYDQSIENWDQKPSQYHQSIGNVQNDEMDSDYDSYLDDGGPLNPYSQNKQLVSDEDDTKNTNRNTRSRIEEESVNEQTTTASKTQKKNLADTAQLEIYGYKNIKNSKNRLLHDVNNLPTEILRDTYFRNRERQLKKSRFEQRDLLSHRDKIKENEEIRQFIDAEKINSLNASENLWNLESDKEQEDRENGYYRGKRDTNATVLGIPRLTSVGTLAKSMNSTNNSIDLIFLTYWLPPINGAQLVLEKDVQCISDKIKNALNSKEKILNYQKSTLEELFKNECIAERIKQNEKSTIVNNGDVKDNFPYYNQIAHLNLGQMTVYRVRLECTCEIVKRAGRCAKFLSHEDQRWPSYLGKFGDGVFQSEV